MAYEVCINYHSDFLCLSYMKHHSSASFMSQIFEMATINCSLECYVQMALK